MTAGQIDYVSVFQHLPTPALIMTCDFVILDVNQAYERITGRRCGDLINKSIFAAFPSNPAEPGISGPVLLRDSLDRVIRTGRAETLPLQRYDVRTPGDRGEYKERYWCPMNIPVTGPDGEVALILHVVEEVPELIRRFVDAEAADA